MDINQQINEVLESFPHLNWDKDNLEFTGELSIAPDDSYDIQIVIGRFPIRFPLVYEVGERIPLKIDRHIYPSTGNCCLTTAAKECILLKTKIKTLHDFISLIVVPYFQNNSFYELNKKYKEGEYSHGAPGVIEGYRDILSIEKMSLIPAILKVRVSGGLLNNRNECYCGSGFTLKTCKNGLHKRSYKEFKRLDIALLKHDLYKIINPFIREIGLRQLLKERSKWNITSQKIVM
ncbi:hypothetical protein CW751_08065 [Brumimicrobium salinarum]|uniref:SEC-C domain-containing protein n=1 Tax=Brumimicrobium salinarum TaxID=2058658 RepID=A0A2I0R2C1_9FLAO|nr:hypothetical protein [Brumimicrobium salinarum]PKR80716.1 hypothetical protein CW751_08065 [Brumimicrobium salinarum]